MSVDLSQIEIKLKDNQLLVYLNEKSSHIYKAVRYFCANDDSDARNKINRVAVKQKFKNRTRKLQSAPVLPTGTSKFYFEDTLFTIQIKEYGAPLACEGWTGFHEQMYILIEENDKSYKENKAIFLKFFETASVYLKEKWMDMEDEDKKVSIYIWDENYWETLEKSLSRKLSTIYLDGMENEIYEKIKNFKSEETEKLYKDFGIPYKYNILFHGVPGTGKTSLIFSIASELKMNIAIMTFTNDMNDNILMRCFRRIPENCILVIEDIDALFESRKKNDEFKNNITFSGLLNTMDGIAHVDKQIIIMTTNHPLVLDAALKRPGRVDFTFEFKYSSKSQIKTMFERFLPNQKDKFSEFYCRIKNLKITTAMLQQFFFGNRLQENILEHTEELEKLANDNRYEPKMEHYT